jgi:Protein of unknown function (DUF3306)
MSGPDQSDHDKREDKGFLARWSQRKQEAKRSEQDAPVAKSDVPSEPLLAADAEPEFDLSSLPKLEEITATTDISAFLRKGVPEQLRNAALRKSWALDPAIRNYVSPALDYAYDWNTPGGVPGSSEIGAGVDVARMVSQIMGNGESASEPTVVETSTQVTNDRTNVQQGAQSPTLPEQSQRLSGNTVPFGEPGGQIAKIEDSEGTDHVASQQPMRRHGSAKPSA